MDELKAKYDNLVKETHIFQKRIIKAFPNLTSRRYDRNTLLYKKSKGTLKLSKTSKYDDSDGLSEPTKAPAIHIEKSLKSSTRLPAVCLGGGIAIALLTVLWVYLYSDNN